MTTYTVGEVARLGLLKSHLGKPYKDKATVLRILQSVAGIKRVKTPFGLGYAVTDHQIDVLNSRWK